MTNVCKSLAKMTIRGFKIVTENRAYRRTLLRAEVEAAHIRADAAITCEENRSSSTAPLVPPFSAYKKVGDYLDSLTVALSTGNGKKEAPTPTQAPVEPYLRHGSLLNPSLVEMEKTHQPRRKLTTDETTTQLGSVI